MQRVHSPTMSTMVLGGASSTVFILVNCGPDETGGGKAGWVGRWHAEQASSLYQAPLPCPASQPAS